MLAPNTHAMVDVPATTGGIYIVHIADIVSSKVNFSPFSSSLCVSTRDALIAAFALKTEVVMTPIVAVTVKIVAEFFLRKALNFGICNQSSKPIDLVNFLNSLISTSPSAFK